MKDNLKTMLNNNEFIIAPGCHDPLSAKIIESIGYKAAYLGGWASGAMLGVSEPLTTMTEMVNLARSITYVCDIPLIVDADAGFGEISMLPRVVKEFEKAGVSAIHFEDQIVPKRAHYHKGEITIIDEKQMILKLKIALESRKNKDMLIIARTDAGRNKGEDFSKAIERANKYYETGVDMVMVFPRTAEEIQQAAKNIEAPLLFVASEGLGRYIPNVKELKELGFKVVVYPLSSVLVSYDAIKKAYLNLLKDGETGLTRKKATQLSKEIQDLIGINRFIDLEERMFNMN
jgi:methylisocitrate lyase